MIQPLAETHFVKVANLMGYLGRALVIFPINRESLPMNRTYIKTAEDLPPTPTHQPKGIRI